MRTQTTEDLKTGVFEDELDRRAFIDQIIGYEIDREPSEELFMERFPDSDTIGTVYFPADDIPPWAADEELLPSTAALFVPAEELEVKRKPALDWLRGVGAWDVVSAVIVYTLTDDQSDFASLERLWPDWVPEPVKPGDTIRYAGIAHPSPGAKGICLHIYNEPFAIEEIIFLDEPWYGIRNLATNETLWITEMLLMGSATFDCVPERSFRQYDTPIGNKAAFEPETEAVPMHADPDDKPTLILALTLLMI